jgi:hypothetical protein
MSSRALPPLLRLGVLTACCAWAMALSVETFARQPRASIVWPDQFEHEGVIWERQRLDPLNPTSAKVATASLPPGVLQLNEASYRHGSNHMELIVLRSSSSGFSGSIRHPDGCKALKHPSISQHLNSTNKLAWIAGLSPMKAMIKEYICIKNQLN